MLRSFYHRLFIKNRTVFILVVSILFFSLIFRFINFENRWTLSQDQARDAIIGVYAIENQILPPIGPPSSAGQFSFGPYYYWLIMFFTVIFPVTSGPWIGFTLISVGVPLLFFWIGFKYGGKIFGLILGLIAAFSSELVFHSTDMLNPIPVSFFSSLLFLLFYFLIEKKKVSFAFWIGLFIGISINFHLQAIGLIIFIPLISLFCPVTQKERVKIIGTSLLGVLISFLPLIYFDLNHQNILSHNLFQFLIKGNQSAGYTNNFFVDLLIFWPQLWGQTLAHSAWVGYLFLLLFIGAGVYLIDTKKNIPKSFLIFGIGVIFQIFFLYFYSGVRSPIYLLVFQPFFILLTGWVIWIIYSIQRYVAFGILLLLLTFSSVTNITLINDNNSQISEMKRLKETIDKQIRGNIRILSNSQSHMVSFPLYYLYTREKRVSESGDDIFVCENTLVKEENGITEKWSCPMDIQTLAEYKSYKVYHLAKLSDEEKKLFTITPVSSKDIYQSLFEHYKK